jgi:hypothetical protein
VAARLTADQLETYPSTLDSNHFAGRSVSAVCLFLWRLPSSGGTHCPKTVESLPNCSHYNLQECTSVRGSKTMEFPPQSHPGCRGRFTAAGATLLPPAFAFGHGCGSEDDVPLALRTPRPAVAHLPVVRPPAASTVPTTPRYLRLDLDATATVVDDVV